MTTVKELIEILKSLPEDAPLIISSYYIKLICYYCF